MPDVLLSEHYEILSEYSQCFWRLLAYYLAHFSSMKFVDSVGFRSSTLPYISGLSCARNLIHFVKSIFCVQCMKFLLRAASSPYQESFGDSKLHFLWFFYFAGPLSISLFFQVHSGVPIISASQPLDEPFQRVPFRFIFIVSDFQFPSFWPDILHIVSPALFIHSISIDYCEIAKSYSRTLHSLSISPLWFFQFWFITPIAFEMLLDHICRTRFYYSYLRHSSYCSFDFISLLSSAFYSPWWCSFRLVPWTGNSIVHQLRELKVAGIGWWNCSCCSRIRQRVCYYLRSEGIPGLHLHQKVWICCFYADTFVFIKVKNNPFLKFKLK